MKKAKKALLATGHGLVVLPLLALEFQAIYPWTFEAEDGAGRPPYRCSAFALLGNLLWDAFADSQLGAKVLSTGVGLCTPCSLAV